MKRTIIFLFLVLSGTFLFSQQSPVMYLSIMPKYSGNSCEITDADTAKISNFQNKMSIFRESLGNDLNERKEALDNFMENNEDQIRENMLGQQGYSKEDAQKLKNADNMSEEEKMAIANQMLMDKMGMDVNDFKKLAEMDTSAQKSWAQGYGTMMMADAMANPQKNQEEQKRFKDQFDLVSEQKFMIEKIRAAENKYFQQLDTLQKEADTAQAQMNRVFDRLYKQIADCEDGGCVESKYDQMNQMKKDYCYRFSPVYEKIVNNFGIYLMTSLEDYDSLDIISNRLLESQTGIKNHDFKPGISGLSIVSYYAGLASAILKYYHSETTFGIGEEGTISN